MNQPQLLALDAILPTLVGFGGLIFVAVALWPVGREFAKRDRLASVAIGAIGVLCLLASVWLWLLLFAADGQPPIPRLSPGAAATPAAAGNPAGGSASGGAGSPGSGSTAPGNTAGGSGNSAGNTAHGSGNTAGSSAGSSTAGSGSTGASSPDGGSGSADNSATGSGSSAGNGTGAAVPGSPNATPAVKLTPVAAVPFQTETGVAHGVTVGVQPFEHGFMIYRSDTQQIYVLTSDKHFKVYPDTWTDSQPDLGNLTPVAGKYRPGRGFGKLWNANPDVQRALGLALTPEKGFTGRVSGDATSTTIEADASYVFKTDGTWAEH